MDSLKIRKLYETFGAENYYRDHASEYQNPHFPQIRELLTRNVDQLDSSGVMLDFAGGSGEVSIVLRALGMENIEGCDPFTFDLYEKTTGLPCWRLTFMDVIKQGLPKEYSTIICSFAMHLCAPKDLFSLTWNLFQRTDLLIIITPHKRPELENLPGVDLIWQDSALTERGKKVHMKAYRLQDGLI